MAACVRLGRRLPKVSAPWLWGAYALVCFLLFLAVTFPQEALVRRILSSVTRDTRVRVEYGSGGVSGWGRLTLNDVIIDWPAGALPQLRLARLSATPSLWGLVRSEPFPLTVEAAVYGGQVVTTIDSAEPGRRLQFAMQRLALERLPLSDAWRLTGRLDASGALRGDLADLRTATGSLAMVLSDGRLQEGHVNGFRLPALPAVSGRLRLSLQGGRLNIASLALSLPGLELGLGGTIDVRTPVGNSICDLRLTAHVTGSPPSQLAPFLSLLRRSPDDPSEYTLAIGGTLTSPAVR